MKSRTWRWLVVRIVGLLTRPPLIGPAGEAVPSTRLGLVINPPKKPDDNA